MLRGRSLNDIKMSFSVAALIGFHTDSLVLARFHGGVYPFPKPRKGRYILERFHNWCSPLTLGGCHPEQREGSARCFCLVRLAVQIPRGACPEASSEKQPLRFAQGRRARNNDIPIGDTVILKVL